ncbi:phosphotransferase family protein [Variovorax sp. J22P168]|uniref:phosphotransferase family protein n=1 Tax=Variovorax jilinensis TaxID=3053513 RepID=UPI002579038B|nr:phosphotransferase family protein [Variovorax sp. J22P168]MDM0015136.1 phosphotransferase family protein [Variovorax sp. J22P168]
MNTFDIRDTPTSEFVEALRRRYPIEPEIDRLLTRKMERRSGPSYSMVSLEVLSGSLIALLKDTLQDDFEVSDQCWLAGGASKLQMRFTLRWNDPTLGRTISDLVVRMEPSESINASSRLREFELLRALEGLVPVPKMYWVDPDGKWFPEPALIYAFANGVAKPTSIVSGSVTGIGTNFGPRLRQMLGPQFVDYLAKIHTFDHEGAHLESFSRPEIGTTESAQLQINRTLRVWEEDRGEEFALMDVAASWLARNVPTLDRASVVHGDYRAGNFLFDEASGAFTAVLDWERAYIGDRHRDLAWSTARVIGHMAEDGKTYLICGLMPLEEFYDRYQEASGLEIDPVKLHFYEVLNRYQQVTTVLGTAYRVVRLGKSHQNIVVARLQTAAYLLAEELRSALEEVL